MSTRGEKGTFVRHVCSRPICRYPPKAGRIGQSVAFITEGWGPAPDTNTPCCRYHYISTGRPILLPSNRGRALWRSLMVLPLLGEPPVGVLKSRWQSCVKYDHNTLCSNSPLPLYVHPTPSPHPMRHTFHYVNVCRYFLSISPYEQGWLWM